MNMTRTRELFDTGWKFHKDDVKGAEQTVFDDVNLNVFLLQRPAQTIRLDGVQPAQIYQAGIRHAFTPFCNLTGHDILDWFTHGSILAWFRWAFRLAT